MQKIARMLRSHRDLILNYFKAQKLFKVDPIVKTKIRAR
jgi:hypothetical protein